VGVSSAYAISDALAMLLLYKRRKQEEVSMVQLIEPCSEEPEVAPGSTWKA
jgi:hypothetical protein